MSRKTYPEEINFVTLTVVDWVDVFTRRTYNDFIMENLTHCQNNKDLKIYSYVLMTNHLHLVAYSEKNLLSDILRDLKLILPKSFLKCLGITSKKVKDDGCWIFSEKEGLKIKKTKTISFGRKGIILLLYIQMKSFSRK